MKCQACFLEKIRYGGNLHEMSNSIREVENEPQSQIITKSK